MKTKKIMAMTSFGPVPYEVIKGSLPKEIVDGVDFLVQKIDKIESSETAKSEETATAASTEPNFMNVNYYIESLAKKMRWKPEKMRGYLNTLWEINPSAAFSVLLKEIAIELDKKYKDHISNCKEFFIISTADGRIHKTLKAYIKNFRNFAAFRTEEDARIACRILRLELKEMFGDRK